MASTYSINLLAHTTRLARELFDCLAARAALDTSLGPSRIVSGVWSCLSERPLALVGLEVWAHPQGQAKLREELLQWRRR